MVNIKVVTRLYYSNGIDVAYISDILANILLVKGFKVPINFIDRPV